MRKDIHPKWYPEARATCACGKSFITGSTLPEIHVDICSKCHPFFTGEMKFVDVQGRVEKFQAKQKAAAAITYIKKKDRRQAKVKKETEGPKTLKEMLSKKS